MWMKNQENFVFCSQKLDNSLEKPKISEKCSILIFYVGRVFYWYHSQFTTMTISIGQNCPNKKNPVEYIVLHPPTKGGVGTKNIQTRIHAYIHTYIHIYIHTYIHTFTHIFIYIYIYIYIQTYIYNYMHL